jgi:hypothetical protein
MRKLVFAAMVSMFIFGATSVAGARATHLKFTVVAKVTSTQGGPHSSSFTESLKNKQGKKLGSDTVFCKETGFCSGVWNFKHKGKIDASGTLDFNNPETQQIAVTDGTKHYDGAKGTLDFDFVSDTKTNETFKIAVH